MQSKRYLVPIVAAISLGLALGTASTVFADASSTPDTATSTATSTSATSTPQITNVRAVNVTATRATVKWHTDQLSDSRVFYGTTTPLTASVVNSTMTTDHAVILTGLTANTLYHFDVRSKNANGVGRDTDRDDDRFTTASSTGGGTGTTTPATTISGIGVSAIGTTSATISWNTDQAADAQVSYGTTAGYGSTSTLDSTASTTHSVTLANLAAGTTYHFMVMSNNANGMATSSDQTFMTASSSGTGSGGGTGGTITGSTTEPVLAIDSITTDKGSATPDGSFGDGWQWTFHFTVPTGETQFALDFSDFANASSTIPAANNIRYYSAQSGNATSSDSAVMITGANAYPTTMLDLNGDTDGNAANGRQVDVVVQMAVPSGTTPGSYTASWNAESTTTATSTP